MRRTPGVMVRFGGWFVSGEWWVVRGTPHHSPLTLFRTTHEPASLLLALRAFLGVLLLGDVALAGVLQGGGAFGVELGEARPLAWDVGFGEDGLDRALGDARLAVDAID